MPRLKPYSRSAVLLLRADLAEHAADLRAAAEQVRGLAADDLEVLVLGDVDVAGLRELIELAFDHPQRDVAEQPDDLERVLRQRHRHRLDVEVVAEQDGDVVAPARVHGQAAAAQIGAVDDVVVDERRGVDELDDRRRRARRGRRCSRSAAPPSAARPGAPACRRSSGCSLPISGISATRDWMCRDEFPLDRLEIVADRLEDLRQVGRRRGVLRCIGQGGVSSGKDRFTILNFRAGCQRAKPLRFDVSFRPLRRACIEIAGSLARRVRRRSTRRAIVGQRSQQPATTYAGSLRLPRYGTGARYGRVGFGQKPIRRARSAPLAADRLGLREGHDAGEREVRIRGRSAARAIASSPVKQWNTPRTCRTCLAAGCAKVSSVASRV